MRNSILLLVAGLFIFPTTSWADIYEANSCSLADVATAYNKASTGDVVVVPAGECTWSSALKVEKAITIVGAGFGASGTKLIASGAMPQGFFDITGIISSKLVRISRFFFEMHNFTTQTAIYVHSVNMDKIRIDHNKFNHGSKAILFYNPKGVIDNNYFYNGNLTIEFSAGSEAYANASWESMAAGTEEALFIENNHFIDDANYTAAFTNERIGTFNGGKLVVRYNHFESYDFPLDATITPIMTHGSAAGGVKNGYWQQGTGARRGQPVVEIYENIMEGKRIDWMAIVRGSANLIYNNTLISLKAAVSRIQLREEETTVASNWPILRIAWPAEDQVHNTFIWGNTFNGKSQSSSNIIVVPDNAPPNELIKENRDYFLHEPQATGGREIFTGKNGASGSFPTDGVTYPTLGTMVFDPSGPNAYYGYKPYTYPHPHTKIPLLFEGSIN